LIAAQLLAIGLFVGPSAVVTTAVAQDVVGIENCLAEKQIERRTSCLQSNINFLKSTLTSEVGKARADAQARIDEARKQIAALQSVVTALQDEIRKLRGDLEAARPKAPQAQSPASAPQVQSPASSSTNPPPALPPAPAK
jgi:septal ring factor EnvC (AmiA/AmiB activator)